MPISLSEIQSKTRTVTVDVAEAGSLQVTYRPSVYTPSFESQINRYIAERNTNVLGWMLSELVQEWDLYEDDEMQVPVPLEPERLSTLPIRVLGAISEAITGDMRPNRPSAGTSGGGSLAN